eukprot:jgi/Mesvir1/19372/Mv10416-RA.2
MFSRWARVIGHMAAVRDATVFDYGSGHAHMSTAAETFRRLCEGLPIYVAQTAHAGRGVFARDDIPAGTRIHMAIPVVQHPTHAHIHEACYRCLAPLPLAARSASMKAKASLAAAKGGRVSMHEYAAFCEPGPGAGRSCRELAQEEFLASESSLDLSEFEHFCSGMGAEEDVAPAGQKAAKYPLLVARLANLCAQGASAPDALSHLNFVNLPHPPPEEPPTWSPSGPRTPQPQWLPSEMLRKAKNCMCRTSMLTCRHLNVREHSSGPTVLRASAVVVKKA